MSDSSVVQMGTAFIALLGTVFSGIMAYLMARLNSDQKARAYLAAMKVEEVKDTLVRTSDKASKKVEEVKDALVQTSMSAAHKVDEVKETLVRTAEDATAQMDALAKEKTLQSLTTSATVDSQRMDRLAKVAAATHRLVNSGALAQLEINMRLARRLADMTGDPADSSVAERARELYEHHVTAQAAVDSQPGTDAEKAGSV